MGFAKLMFWKFRSWMISKQRQVSDKTSDCGHVCTRVAVSRMFPLLLGHSSRRSIPGGGARKTADTSDYTSNNKTVNLF